MGILKRTLSYINRYKTNDIWINVTSDLNKIACTHLLDKIKPLTKEKMENYENFCVNLFLILESQ
jgi:hypothetical protein